MAKKSPPRQIADLSHSKQHISFSGVEADTVSELVTRLKGNAIGRRIWTELLTPHEQSQVPLLNFLARHPVDVFAQLRRISRERAVLDLAHEMELLSGRQYRLLLQQLSLTDRNAPDRPAWNADRLELTLRGQVVRRIRNRGRAHNAVRILDTFQELGWSDRIDDPLRGGADPERLRDTIKSLNRGLTGLRFRADGTGCGVVWELL